MMYVQSREQSAEILRSVISLMAGHDAAFNPVSFALWYEHVAGINTRLSSALQAKLGQTPKLSNEDVLALFKEYIAPVDQQAVERISGEFQRAMQGIVDSAARTGEEAGKFGAHLDGLAQALKSGAVENLTPHVDQALANTADMQQSAQALQRQVVASRMEIEKLHAELGRVREESLLDPLTRVMNRRGFDQRIADLLLEPGAQEQSHCLIMLDIDHFKKVNDTHGHVTGDRVIQGLGEVLRASVDAENCTVARYGGEEFVVLLPNTPVAKGIQVAELVCQRTRSMKIRNRKTHDVLQTVTVSAGVSKIEPGDDASRWVARADRALYQSKQNGRDRVTVI